VGDLTILTSANVIIVIKRTLQFLLFLGVYDRSQTEISARDVITIFNYMIVFILYLAFDICLHYLTFMGRNLGNMKKSPPIWLVISVGMNTI
jgi:hypothetical protein